jgi:fructose-bisphosphate aldolase, class I
MRSMDQIKELLGEESEKLLGHTCKGVPKESLNLPGPDFVDRIFAVSDRTPQVLRNLQALFGTGRLANTGYLSFLPVDQGIEHSAGASFAPNPIYFDPENIVKLAIEGGCNGVASTLGVLGSVARKYAHKIPFILKLNHNELLSYPNKYDQTMFASVQQAFDLGAAAVGATIYFGHEKEIFARELVEVSEAFQMAHELGLVTILWCYLRNPVFKIDGVDHHTSADLSGQANHIGATIEADFVKQKQPTQDGGYAAMKKKEKYGEYKDKMYEYSGDNPIDQTRIQVLNCYAGRVGLINSGGSSGKNDLAQAIRTAIINKRAGGMGLITGRKAFQKPMKEGVELFHAIQDVYLNKDITVA